MLVLLTLSPGARAADKVAFVMSNLGYHYLPLFAAVELGLMGEEGIEASLTEMQGGAKAMAAILSGDAQIYMGAPSTVFRARGKGTDPIALGAQLTQFGSNFVITGDWARQHGITAASSYEDKLRALRGMRVGVTSVGSGTDQMARYLALAAGINPDRDLQIVGLGSGEANLSAFAQGRVDGFLYNSPSSDLAVRNYGGLMLFNTVRGEIAYFDGFLYGTVIARESWAKQKPDLVVRILRGAQKGLDAVHDPARTEKARDLVWARWHKATDKAFYDQLWTGQIPAFPKTIRMTQAQMDRNVEFVNRFEKEPLDPAAVRSGWTNDYADKALASLGQ